MSKISNELIEFDEKTHSLTRLGIKEFTEFLTELTREETLDLALLISKIGSRKRI